MKFLDFSELLEGDPAHIAFLSTFQFDPDFFEKRLLRCSTLARARRIVIFLDARQWYDLLRRDVPARWLNRRYLVVPVHRSQGVFHPKLNLFLTENGGQVQCGSNNLTRSGCANNLELLNAVPFAFEEKAEDARTLAREAFAFFEQAARETEDEIARIAGEWTTETAATYPWLKQPLSETDRGLRLLHTYSGAIWPRLVEYLSPRRPTDFFVISPFHDGDAEMCRRLSKQWPRARIELLVQQGYTNLPVLPLKKLRQVRLSELCDSSRRVHAKLFAWKTAVGSGCLVGSANFTSAALDGRNVEACLFVEDTSDLIGSLFDRHLVKRPLALSEFEPGNAEEPDAEPEEPPAIRIKSALLKENGTLSVSYSHRYDQLSSLRLSIRTPGESRPRASIPLPRRSNTTESVTLKQGTLSDCQGTLLATLLAEIGEARHESLPVWVIQEHRLTYEPSEGASSSKGKLEETGEGLQKEIDELGKREGLAAVIDYLRHLNIRFQDGGGGGPGPRKLRLKIRDPFQPDVPPGWLIAGKAKSNDLEEAIYEFVERHERHRLNKHVNRGNINGMENFLDILTTLIRLLYVYFKRGVVKKDRLIGRLCHFVLLATLGKDSEKAAWGGYLYSVYDNLSGDVKLLQEVCDERNYLAEVRAALLIVQSIRFNPKEEPSYGPKPTRPRDVLAPWAKAIETAIAECDLTEPSSKNVHAALDGYRMFTEDEINRLVAEL